MKHLIISSLKTTAIVVITFIVIWKVLGVVSKDAQGKLGSLLMSGIA